MTDAYLAKIDTLISAIEGTGIAEIEVAEPTLRIRIVMAHGPALSSPGPVQSASITPLPIDRAAPASPAAAPTGAIVEAPSYGQFHRSPAPGATPFVEVGRPVQQGQEICIIEAMKVFTTVRSPIDGIVKEILVENGADVAPGQALIRIEQLIADAAQ